MTQRAYVERFTSSGNDGFGNPLPAVWAEHLPSLPIFLYGSTEREVVTEETTAVVTDLRALIPLSADVTESDRLGGPVAGTAHPAVVNRLGAVIEPAILHVETVLNARTHLELTLSRVSA
jgi:hypothetical protein